MSAKFPSPTAHPGGGFEGCNDASESANVTIELVRRGYTEVEIAMHWSSNLMRVLDDVQLSLLEARPKSNVNE